MIKYICDRCGKELANESDMERAEFELECSTVFGEPTRIRAYKELCSECSYYAIQMFKELINNM